MMKNNFYFTLKALFVLKMFDLWESSGWFYNLWRHNLANKQLQYTTHIAKYLKK